MSHTPDRPKLSVKEGLIRGAVNAGAIALTSWHPNVMHHSTASHAAETKPGVHAPGIAKLSAELDTQTKNLAQIKADRIQAVLDARDDCPTGISVRIANGTVKTKKKKAPSGVYYPVQKYAQPIILSMPDMIDQPDPADQFLDGAYLGVVMDDRFGSDSSIRIIKYERDQYDFTPNSPTSIVLELNACIGTVHDGDSQATIDGLIGVRPANGERVTNADGSDIGFGDFSIDMP